VRRLHPQASGYPPIEQPNRERDNAQNKQENMKILIIEDDPTSLKLASEVLQAGGHVIMLATSADQAILSIKAVKPDVILLDMRLPGIKGPAVARQCREETLTHDIPIIAVTAFSAEFGEADARKAGCDAYLTKPINTRTFLRQIEEVVAAKAKTTAATTGT
jgi:CheY-like chemotaxis protein